MMNEKYATIEILDDGEEIFESVPNGRYMVREFDGDVEMGAEFYESILDAENTFLIIKHNPYVVAVSYTHLTLPTIYSV